MSEEFIHPSTEKREIPAAAMGGQAERSDGSRSDPERSAACPPMAAANANRPPASPPPLADPAGHNVMPNLAEEPLDALLTRLPPLGGHRRRGRRLVKKDAAPASPLTPEQRLLLLDTWRRSGLPAGDFAALVGISKHTLYAWQKRFKTEGPAGLMDAPRGRARGSRLPELTKRTILMLKEANPTWGCQRISDMLLRGPALPASPAAVALALHEAGYQMEEVPTRPHPDKVRHFERARPNQLWQTDLFTFILKRQNRRVYLVAFMDDHSRFIVGYGLHASQSTALVLEVLRSAITSHGAPEEVLTDNGTQYITWRGKSAFTKELEKRGIKQIVAAPRHPQTLGKIERFWGTLWRECIESAIFLDLGDAQRRIGWFIDHYNFQRPHQGVDGLVPADRFFGSASEVLKTLQARVAANALELARQGAPKAPFYLTGRVGDQPFSVHAEGERMIMTGADGRREIDLLPPATASAAEALPEPVCPMGQVTRSAEDGNEEPPAPGTSPLDQDLAQVRSAFAAAPLPPEPASREPVLPAEPLPATALASDAISAEQGGAS